MPHNSLPADQMQALLTTLSSTFAADIGSNLRLIGSALPGKAVCAILKPTGDGITRVVYDPNKPNAMAHTHEMVQGWWERGQPGRPCPLPSSEPVEYAVMS